VSVVLTQGYFHATTIRTPMGGRGRLRLQVFVLRCVIGILLVALGVTVFLISNPDVFSTSNNPVQSFFCHVKIECRFSPSTSIGLALVAFLLVGIGLYNAIIATIWAYRTVMQSRELC
jgi:hypothetical protein